MSTCSPGYWDVRLMNDVQFLDYLADITIWLFFLFLPQFGELYTGDFSCFGKDICYITNMCRTLLLFSFLLRTIQQRQTIDFLIVAVIEMIANLVLAGPWLFNFKSKNPCHDFYFTPGSKRLIFPNLVIRSCLRKLIVHPKRKHAPPLRVSV